MTIEKPDGKIFTDTTQAEAVTPYIVEGMILAHTGIHGRLCARLSPHEDVAPPQPLVHSSHTRTVPSTVSAQTKSREGER